MKPYPALILWADAHSADIGTWHPIEDLEDTGEFLNRTVGFVIEDAKRDHVTVCQSITPDEQVDHVLHIPMGMIRKIQRLQDEPTD